ncbi:DUF4410 domain-containing protein [Coraliomargarita sp. W4R53]
MNKKICRLCIFFSTVVVLSFFYTGCASSSVRVPGETAVYTISSNNPIRKVTVGIEEGTTETIKFDQERLRRSIEIALKNSAMFDGNAALNSPELNVSVTNLRVRSSFNAMMWGAMAGSDSLQGDVVLRDHTGQKLDEFSVKASYALGGLAGQDEMRMDWLYEAFSGEIVKEFKGENIKK